MPIIALVSERGAGDKPPVLALAMTLRDRGHAVHLLCDGDVADVVGPTGLATLELPQDLRQSAFYDPFHLPRMAGRGETIEAETPDPLTEWAEACLPVALAMVRPLGPGLLLSTLFCMGLADRMATALHVPWILVNPSFYFGDDARRPWEEDFPGLGAGVFRYWFLPRMQRATAVLHATDSVFDPPPPSLPRNHRYVGPLDMEPAPNPAGTSFLHEPGDPWVLVTLSTLPQAGELAIARAALTALADQPVRLLVTLAPGHSVEELGPVPSNTRLSGYLPHGLVLDRACLLIGHAGHGMVMRGLRHGVPMVLIPWGRDQVGVAARAAAMGVAEVVPRGDCTPERVAQAITRVLAEPRYADAARRASERLHAEDALSHACEAVEEVMATHDLFRPPAT
ncbi:glycosyltransferase [Sabulicella rubraurantiaca]|uniref:glycosyltransferase n=1 Tax=Sabulicella rubraurantiaca TaxID=2811429 RepID=UPI001A972DA9|nr:nucleotide disphospho-sugar-binding domain-containing protein [Sabulicella rubraurantiaca]